jgi:hypothetical protein
LVIIKIKDTNKDIFDEQNHEILDYISITSIYKEYSKFYRILSHSTLIKNPNNHSLFATWMCENNLFDTVCNEMNKYLTEFKIELESEYNFYKNSKVVQFLKNNSYEKIEELLKTRSFQEYKDLMYKLIDTINIDFDDNYDLYEYDHYKHKYNIYLKMKNISDKLKEYYNQPNILYYISY